MFIDTTNVLVTGQGQINHQTEALDLSLQGKPKKVPILRLRTPILVRGTLLELKIGVQAGKLAAQTDAALALATRLTRGQDKREILHRRIPTSCLARWRQRSVGPVAYDSL